LAEVCRAAAPRTPAPKAHRPARQLVKTVRIAPTTVNADAQALGTRVYWLPVAN
jgi:hypothetical protein